MIIMIINITMGWCCSDAGSSVTRWRQAETWSLDSISPSVNCKTSILHGIHSIYIQMKYMFNIYWYIHILVNLSACQLQNLNTGWYSLNIYSNAAYICYDCQYMFDIYWYIHLLFNLSARQLQNINAMLLQCVAV